ncbi:MAG: Uncharacterised protein [Flavobacterium sp. SCGC AAA160-P02]|nr:MAG: Uncharacterised protein [Flavobacterium sp. SCGC AAA160-P02]
MNKKISKKASIILGYFLVIISLFSIGVLFGGGVKGLVFLIGFIFNTFILISGIRFIKGEHKYK